MVRCHSSAVAELLHLIKKLEELHTKVKGIVSSPYLATTLMYDLSWRWRLYLNMCVAVLAAESLEDPETNFPFLLNPILVNI